MQYPKEELKNRILEVARKEFLLKGFQQASLRKIAREAEMTTGGIYTYFQSKEDIFDTIVKKVAQKWEQKYLYFLSAAGVEKSFIDIRDAENPECMNSSFYFLFNFISVYRDEMKLLFFKSSGTRYQDFPATLEKEALFLVRKFLMKLPSNHNYPYYRVSDFFLSNIIKFNINLIHQMLNEDIPLEKMISYEEEISSFFYNGWKALLHQYSA
jgi:AcrR family transcriptional regulator